MTWRKTLKLEKFDKILHSYGFNNANRYSYEYGNIGRCLTLSLDSKNEVKYIDLWFIDVYYDSYSDVISYYGKYANKIQNITKKKIKNILTDYRNHLNGCMKKSKQMEIQNKLKNIEKDFK